MDDFDIDLVLLGTLPDYGNASGVQLSEKTWAVVGGTVPQVTIAYGSGASSVASDNAAAVVNKRNLIRGRETRVFYLIPTDLIIPTSISPVLTASNCLPLRNPTNSSPDIVGIVSGI